MKICAHITLFVLDKQFDTLWTELVIPIYLLFDQLTVSTKIYSVENFFHLYEESSNNTSMFWSRLFLNISLAEKSTGVSAFSIPHITGRWGLWTIGIFVIPQHSVTQRVQCQLWLKESLGSGDVLRSSACHCVVIHLECTVSKFLFITASNY
jgi:hypothetical protein